MIDYSYELRYQVRARTGQQIARRGASRRVQDQVWFRVRAALDGEVGRIQSTILEQIRELDSDVGQES